jgi:hypothetical protein
MSESYVILDLDGCISDDRHRQHLIPQWDAYHGKAHIDAPANQELVASALAHGSLPVIVTGRCASVRSRTELWLRDHFKLWPQGGDGKFDAATLDCKPCVLLMRPQGVHRPASFLKPALLDEFDPEWPRKTLEAYDDRADILRAYEMRGVYNTRRLTVDGLCPDWTPRYMKAVVAAANPSAADVLQEMADTYRERNAVYGSNYKMVGPMMRVLFPDGASAELLSSDQFHLFELMLVKLSRFAISGLQHQDSIHDAAVYAAMIDAILKEQK